MWLNRAKLEKTTMRLSVYILGLGLILVVSLALFLYGNGENNTIPPPPPAPPPPAFEKNRDPIQPATLVTAPWTIQPELLPSATVLDINIGTNIDPLKRRENRGLVLVDPLFPVCELLSTKLAKDPEIVFFCLALSNVTGFAAFMEYSKQGVSSSLVAVAPNSSHGEFPLITRRTVLVMEGLSFFHMLLNGRERLVIECLKLDMQGFELTLLRNILPLLAHHKQFEFQNIFMECNCPGTAIYLVKNECHDMAVLLQLAGFTVRDTYLTYCAQKKLVYEWTDLQAYKSPSTGFQHCAWDNVVVTVV